MDQTATLPVAFFQGKSLEEGARCEVEVVAVDNNEVKVRYVPHEGEAEEEAGDRTHPDFNSAVDESAAGGGY